MAPGQNIDLPDLPPEITQQSASESIEAASWQEGLAMDVAAALNRGEQNLLEERTNMFESIMIKEALKHSKGRRIEAANQLGMGRNTLTRKIKELAIEES